MRLRFQDGENGEHVFLLIEFVDTIIAEQINYECNYKA